MAALKSVMAAARSVAEMVEAREESLRSRGGESGRSGSDCSGERSGEGSSGELDESGGGEEIST